ncbi:hypothetical protein GW17_00042120 [Ensete ventricosum]|nr:hypothetical protein GW17_00042120 [Ensete ventricosum]RZS18028.1 hypothetical protein BHM03_00050250 [Ensete ventricosum]
MRWFCASLAAALPTGGPLYGRCCPCGRTGTAARRVQLLRALCSQSPLLWAGAIPEGDASVGATPPGAAYACKRCHCMHQPCPRAAVPAGSSPGRRESVYPYILDPEERMK